MPEGKLLVGNVEVVALTDNAADFPIPLSQLFANVPADAWAPFRQRYPELFSGFCHVSRRLRRCALA
jgi:hypothetical protein